MIERGDYLVTYDDKVGIVYHVMKKAIKTTTASHARAIENCLEKYYSNEMPEKDKGLLEEYLIHSFYNNPEPQIVEYPDLLHTRKIRRLELMVANDCNLNCHYCYANGGNYGLESCRMSATMVVAYLDAFLGNRYDSVEVVMFFGGEPTLCPDTIMAVCEFFRQSVITGRLRNVPVYTMVSNGTLIDEKMAQIISDYEISVTISIDGPQDINDILRVDKAGSGTFVRIVRGIELLKRYHCRVSMLEATYTLKHRELGYDKNSIRRYLRNKFDVENILVADCEDGNGQVFRDPLAVEDQQELYDIFSGEFHVHKVLSAEKFVDITCDAGLASVAIFPSGEIYPCHRFAARRDFCIAKYESNTYDFTPYNDVLKKIRQSQRLRNPECKHCEIRGVCQKCPANILLSGSVSSQLTCQTEIKSKYKMVLNCAKRQLECREMLIGNQE